MILASAYMLHHLPVVWLQSQRIEQSLKEEWVLMLGVAVEHWGLSSIEVYLCQLSD